MWVTKQRVKITWKTLDKYMDFEVYNYEPIGFAGVVQSQRPRRVLDELTYAIH
jgi:hypothetical protein